MRIREKGKQPGVPNTVVIVAYWLLLQLRGHKLRKHLLVLLKDLLGLALLLNLDHKQQRLIIHHQQGPACGFHPEVIYVAQQFCLSVAMPSFFEFPSKLLSDENVGTDLHLKLTTI